jgi:hypothetical protein
VIPSRRGLAGRGLIPILGLAAIAYIIYRAVRDNDD